ncbi:MAG: 3-dehydroquinate synthase [Candidatus Eisenbacteria bacterium]
MKEVLVRLGNRSYPILVSPGILDRAGGEIAARVGAERLFVVTDEHVDSLYGPRVSRSLRRAGFRVHRFVMKPGEARKSLATIRRVYDALAAAGADRSTAVVALGGGVVGDAAGFAAATWHRGIPLVQIPTTLLAQVDSSVGGKTGVNLPSGKNLVGAFHQPALVLADPDCLRTLADREYASGLGEVVKYGMIRDEPFFRRLERHSAAVLARDPEEMGRVVERCCLRKAEYVVADELDLSGRRAHLNYGHTFGHAVESATGYRRYRHGEAVALGMTAASRVSVLLGDLAGEERERLVGLLRFFRLPTSGVPVRPADLLARFRKDKKSRSGRVRIVLTKGIGSAIVSESVPRPLLLRGLREICAPLRG